MWYGWRGTGYGIRYLEKGPASLRDEADVGLETKVQQLLSNQVHVERCEPLADPPRGRAEGEHDRQQVVGDACGTDQEHHLDDTRSGGLAGTIAEDVENGLRASTCVSVHRDEQQLISVAEQRIAQHG